MVAKFENVLYFTRLLNWRYKTNFKTDALLRIVSSKLNTLLPCAWTEEYRSSEYIVSFKIVFKINHERLEKTVGYIIRPLYHGKVLHKSHKSIDKQVLRLHETEK